MRTLPSLKASTTATGGITEAATAGIKNWFERQQLHLSSSMREFKFFYYSARNMTAIKHDTKNVLTPGGGAVKATPKGSVPPHHVHSHGDKGTDCDDGGGLCSIKI